MKKPVDAIFGKAIDIACEGDRVWFEKNPDRNYRLRDVVPFENNGPMAPPAPGAAWRVVVAQIEPDVRTRNPVALSENVAIEGAEDDVCRKIFEATAPKEFLKAFKAAKKNPPSKHKAMPTSE